MAERNEPNSNRHEILKLWVPTHGVITVYRTPNGGKREFPSILHHFTVWEDEINVSTFTQQFTMWTMVFNLKSL